MWSLYWRLVGARIRSQMQYKVSFVLELLGFAVTTGLEFAVVVILFRRFPSVQGWSVVEVGVLYGLSSIAFGLAEMFGRGFDAPFETMMQRGAFDTVLLRPLDSFFQVFASELQLRRLGRTLQGGLVLAYSFAQLSIQWTAAKLLLLPVTIISGTVIFGALLVMGATLCFWTIKTPEVINALTFGGQELTSYPLSIYNRSIRNVFLFVIPLAFVNYPAVLLLLERSDPFGLPAGAAWASPLVAAIFLGIARSFWQLGVSKYASTGS
ncbi:MAG: ABC transporter permease [Chloroflexi bacterium]|nr:MAG: ABC transporter permease [Chloroflexota bacterium]